MGSTVCAEHIPVCVCVGGVSLLQTLTGHPVVGTRAVAINCTQEGLYRSQLAVCIGTVRALFLLKRLSASLESLVQNLKNYCFKDSKSLTFVSLIDLSVNRGNHF